MIQELLQRADQYGFLTLDDVLAFLEEIDDEQVTVESILYELDQLGVEVQREGMDTSLHTMLEPDELVVDEDLIQELTQEPDLQDLNLTVSDDPISLYFRQMSEEPLLSHEEEIELAKRIERGKQAKRRLAHARTMSARWQQHMERLIRDAQIAREHLGRANTRLVVSIAKRYMGQGLPFSDLIQEGNVGLMRAVDKYDYQRGNRFSTYATWWIRQAITRALAQKTRTIRIPLHMTERIRQMYRIAQTIEQERGRRAHIQEIADEMSMPVDMVRNMMDASQHVIALERPVGEDGDHEFGDFLEDTHTPSPADAAVRHLLQETVENILSELSPRQSHILRLRFGLSGTEPHTLEEIANKFGLSRERIRQLEKEALRRLRHPRVSHNLRDYLA